MSTKRAIFLVVILVLGAFTGLAGALLKAFYGPAIGITTPALGIPFFGPLCGSAGGLIALAAGWRAQKTLGNYATIAIAILLACTLGFTFGWLPFFYSP